MSSIAGDPLELTYWHFKEENSAMNWHEITAQSKDFTEAFNIKLGEDRNEDVEVKTYFHARITEIVKAMNVEFVTQKDDPLLMVQRTDFTFVYFSVFKNGLHTGVWMAVPNDKTSTPKLMCCFLHHATTQKLSEWVVKDENDTLKEKVDCKNSINLN